MILVLFLLLLDPLLFLLLISLLLQLLMLRLLGLSLPFMVLPRSLLERIHILSRRLWHCRFLTKLRRFIMYSFSFMDRRRRGLNFSILLRRKPVLLRLLRCTGVCFFAGGMDCSIVPRW